MIIIENTQVMNFEGAVRGARNPMNSWNRSDSGYGCAIEGMLGEVSHCSVCENGHDNSCPNRFREYFIGPKDMELLLKLVKSGTDHSKFMRQIFVSVDVTGPFFWWKEYDTYKVGTVANSCSTMHKIHSADITLEDLSIDYVKAAEDPIYVNAMESLLDAINHARKMFIETKEKKYWRYMIELLPSSYNQKRTLTFTYANLRNMYFARKDHKLLEWHILCDWINTLPYSNLITIT